MKSEQKYDFYWDRRPGLWVDLYTGEPIERPWEGSIKDWYDLLAIVILKECLKIDDIDVNVVATHYPHLMLEHTNLYTINKVYTFGDSSLEFGLATGYLTNRYRLFKVENSEDDDDQKVMLVSKQTTKTLKITGFLP